jgi:hypothetical protein
MRRLRPLLLVLVLTLTPLALSTKVRAAECIDGHRGWADFGSCCFPDRVVQLLPAVCVDGFWEYDASRSGYKCLFTDPC